MSSTRDDDVADDSSEAPPPPKAGPPATADLAALLRSRTGGVDLHKLFRRVDLAHRATGFDFKKYAGLQQPPLVGLDQWNLDAFASHPRRDGSWSVSPTLDLSAADPPTIRTYVL